MDISQYELKAENVKIPNEEEVEAAFNPLQEDYSPPISVDLAPSNVQMKSIDLQLSQSSINLLKQFRQQIYSLKYPRILSQTNITIRSIMQFFYEYQPDKVMSLKLQNTTIGNKTDILVLAMQQDLTDINNINMAKQTASNPLQQDLMSKQLVQVYDLINMQNKNQYVKDPFTFNTYIYSNGYLISTLINVPTHINFYIKNSFNINTLNALFNLRLIQDITKFGYPYIEKIIDFLTAVQVPQSNIYNKITFLNQEDKRQIMLFTGDSNKFTVSRYTIGQYKILFTNMDHVQAYEFIKNKRTADEGSQLTQFIFNESSIIEMKYRVFTAVYQNIIITNITNTVNTINYTNGDAIRYQFDINSIYYIMFISYIIKRDLGLDIRQISPLTFIQMLQNIQYPSSDKIVFQRKIAIPTSLKRKQNIPNVPDVLDQK